MNITLKPDHNKFIEAQVKSGKYSSVDEVIAAALELLADRSDRQQSDLYQEWVDETRPKVAAGLAQLERGEGIDGETVITRLREKFRKMRENQQ
ncbi:MULTISPECIES: type II toxin-antitoxin system ParD family antitoxin [unclassified Microcoleus]|uniref:type II toxin-antitoxin system ParD family antitoxin n=1 Tax=unclassified Microcoleus TaxID=2642155 RepID=UPI002FCF6935